MLPWGNINLLVAAIIDHNTEHLLLLPLVYISKMMFVGEFHTEAGEIQKIAKRWYKFFFTKILFDIWCLDDISIHF